MQKSTIQKDWAHMVIFGNDIVDTLATDKVFKN